MHFKSTAFSEFIPKFKSLYPLLSSSAILPKSPLTWLLHNLDYAILLLKIFSNLAFSVLCPLPLTLTLLHSALLFCTLFYYSTLRSIILHSVLLSYLLFYYSALHSIISHFVLSSYTPFYHSALRSIILHSVLLSYTLFYHPTLCSIILPSVLLF